MSIPVLLGFRVFLQPKGCAPVASLVLVRDGIVEMRPGPRPSGALCPHLTSYCSQNGYLRHERFTVQRPRPGCWGIIFLGFVVDRGNAWNYMDEVRTVTGWLSFSLSRPAFPLPGRREARSSSSGLIVF
jgi:hypothetical protein